jgi:hypothetical protein
MGMSASVTQLVALVLGILPPHAVAGDTVNFIALEGTYISSILGGCELQLRRDASFVLSCRALPLCSGGAIRMGREFGILCGGTAGGGIRTVPRPQELPRASDWPPALRDPTKGPYVGNWGGRGESLWLQPVIWDGRLYLVRSGDHQAFCDAASAGVEPRDTAAGHHFLRRGDHFKRCGTKLPTFCARDDVGRRTRG